MFVTGKGGVGKSTVAIALGMLAARRGQRTIVAELASQERVQRTFDRQGERFEEIELVPGLFTISIDPQLAMEEYLRVKTGSVGQMLGSSRLFHAFAMATPGMRELLSMGKVWELAQLERRSTGGAPYDFVVVDAPATGHGVGILRTPKTFADIALAGPIARQAARIAGSIADRNFTGVVAVATPEEMAVNETVALRDALARDEMALDLAIVNALYRERFDAAEVAELDAALPGPGRRWSGRRSKPRCPSTPGPRPSASSAAGSVTSSTPRSSSCPTCSPTTSGGPNSSCWPTTSRPE